MDSPHVIFIVLDTLRKDYGKVIENSLSRLGFVSYDWAITPAPWTLPAHASIFSGLYPALHGAHETKNRKNFQVKFNGPNTLLRYFIEKNYVAYLISANMFVRPEFGFTGFDKFWDIYPIFSQSLLKKGERDLISKMLLDSNNSKFGLITRLVSSREYKILLKLSLNFLWVRFQHYYRKTTYNWPIDKGSKDAVRVISSLDFKNPTFLFLNLMEVHHPLFLSPPISFYLNFKESAVTESLINLWKKKYLEATYYLNRRLLDIMKILKKKGVFEDSLIVVVSDHGELIGEHGKILHGTFLYDELLRVPLMIKYPFSWDVEIEKHKGYVSLSSLASFIIGLLKGQVHSDRELYSETVFAESYGVSNPINLSLLSEDEKIHYSKLNRYRIAVYHGGFKGVFNIADWTFEEVVSYKGDIDPTEADIKNLKKEVVGFLKRSTSAKIPRIKL